MMMTVPMLLPVLAVTPMMMLLSVLVLVPVPFVIMLLIVIMPMVISVVLAVVVPVLAVAVTAAVTVTMAESGGMRQNPAQGCVPDNAGLLVGGDELDFRASARGWLLPRG